MHPSTKIYTINEFGGIIKGENDCGGYIALPSKTFDALEDFVLQNNSSGKNGAIDFLGLSARRDVGKIITAKNYVGMIAMKDGTVIEILPKIARSNIQIEDTKRIFLEMLKALRQVSFKAFNATNLQVDRLNILEIFIRMFLNEVTTLTKQGLRSTYNSIESNERFFKGKLMVAQDIKSNIASREHVYIRYDEFNLDRAENRLIKSTLMFLQKYTRDFCNKQGIMRLLPHFENINHSEDINTDLGKCFANRGLSHYQQTLAWCKVFLQGNSFTAYSGSEVAIALLFPMEKLFEDYITMLLRQHLPINVHMTAQDSRYSLFDIPSRAFSLRPDIVLQNGNQTIVMDVKWKLLSDGASNYGISQADMYQMYAYSKKYDAEKIVLIYPKTDFVKAESLSFEANDHVKVEVAFLDLLKPKDSIQSTASRWHNHVCV